MIKELKFVQGAVAAKDYVPELQHFKIANGRVEGFNGVLALSSPIDLDIEAMPKAASFVKAIAAVPDGVEVALNLTQAGRLSVKGGKFRAFVECWPSTHETPHVAPSGDIHPIPPGILAVLRKLAPFMGIDASRPWACGIRFDGQVASVTNNVILIQHWIKGLTFPSPLNLPSVAIKEMLRLGIDPVAMQPEARAVTFHYPNGAWLRTSLLQEDWPDLSAVLDRPSDQAPVAPDLFPSIARLDAFGGKENRVFLRDGVVSTSLEEGVGASVEVDGLVADGCYHIGQLALLADVATTIDWSMYPGPVLFHGDNLRGAVAGIRQ